MNIFIVLAHPDPGSFNHALRRRTYSVVVTSTVEQRAEWLSNASALVADAFPDEKRT